MLAFVILIGIFCWMGIFDISDSLINGFIFVAAIPLLLVNVWRRNQSWVKYVLIACVSAAVGIAYAVFTFQPWIEPFQNLWAIIIYVALLRMMQYLFCTVLYQCGKSGYCIMTDGGHGIIFK